MTLSYGRTLLMQNTEHNTKQGGAANNRPQIRRNITMSMTAFILIVGRVLLTLAAINEAIVLLVWLYEHYNHRRR